MNKYRKLIPIVAVVLIALGVNLEQFGIDLRDFTGQQSSSPAPHAGATASALSGSDDLPHLSDTEPKINLRHVFAGEINRKGKPVGYHSRPGGVDAANARINKIQSKPNRAGVYTASISIRDGNQWKEKFSSFFPDKMSQQQVIDAVLHAFKNSKDSSKQPWSGPSGLGFTIQGYTASRGDINTAFPVFVKNQ